MDPFKVKQLDAKQLDSVQELVSKMKILGKGKGYKKDASVSKIKDPHLKEEVIKEANLIEKTLKDRPVSILALLEVARRLRRKYEVIARESVPALLTSVGVKTVDLLTGEKLVVNDKLEASIADKNYMLARKNMIIQRKEDHLEEGVYSKASTAMEAATKEIDLLFKLFLVVDNPTAQIKELLMEADVDYDNKATIAWQTLRKYCKQQLDAGHSIPEGITTFEYAEAELK